MGVQLRFVSLRQRWSFLVEKSSLLRMLALNVSVKDARQTATYEQHVSVCGATMILAARLPPRNSTATHLDALVRGGR